MCGSGTLCIEAAMIVADIAPGLMRPYFGFKGWKGFDADVWAGLLEEARKRREAGVTELPPIVGCDRDPEAVRIAKLNAERAGVGLSGQRGARRIPRGTVVRCYSLRNP